MRTLENIFPLFLGATGTLLLYAAGIVSGCAGRGIPHSDPPEEHFWHDCQETIPAKPDGFQHFVCTDMKDRHWEVLVRRERK